MAQQVVQKLSATKQKRSLGEVKKSEKAKATARKVIRTTVVNPVDIEWPSISEEDGKSLTELLASELQSLRQPNNKVPLNVISKVEKKERRAFRRNWLLEQSVDSGEIKNSNHKRLRGDVAIGVNSVSTALEQDNLCALIIEKEVDPPLLTKLLLPIAKSRAVPAIAIGGLKNICQDAFKTKCIAVGFKVACKDTGHPFYPLYQRIVSGLSSPCKTPCSDSLVRPDESMPDSSVIDPNNKNKRKSDLLNTFKPPKIRKV